MNERQLRNLTAAGIDPDYLDELYDHLASEWAKKQAAAKRDENYRSPA